jgi:hypothetical protein
MNTTLVIVDLETLKHTIAVVSLDFVHAVLIFFALCIGLLIAWFLPYVLVTKPLLWRSARSGYNPVWDRSRRMTLRRSLSDKFHTFNINLKRKSHIKILQLVLFTLICLVALWSALKNMQVGITAFIATFGISGTIAGSLWAGFMMPSFSYLRLETSASFSVGQKISCIINGIKIRMVVIHESQLSIFGVQLDEKTGRPPDDTRLYYYEIPNSMVLGTGVLGFESIVDHALLMEIMERERQEEEIENKYRHVPHPDSHDGLISNYIFNPNPHPVISTALNGVSSPVQHPTQSTMGTHARHPAPESESTSHPSRGISFYDYFKQFQPYVPAYNMPIMYTYGPPPAVYAKNK